MTVITISNQKGGIGKSTTAHAVGSFLSLLKGRSVLLIDADSQGNLTQCTGVETVEGRTVYEVLMKSIRTEDAIYRIEDNLHIIPASPHLVQAPLVMNDTGKEYRLKEALDEIADRYEYAVIDTPPSLSVLTVNALTTADHLVIPAQADIFSLEAVKQLAETIAVVQRYTNPSLNIAGILLTRYQPRSILTKEMTEVISQASASLGTHLFKTRIREAVAVRESQVMHQDIFTYAPKSRVASDYKAFGEELLDRLR